MIATLLHRVLVQQAIVGDVAERSKLDVNIGGPDARNGNQSSPVKAGHKTPGLELLAIFGRLCIDQWRVVVLNEPPPFGQLVEVKWLELLPEFGRWLSGKQILKCDGCLIVQIRLFGAFVSIQKEKVGTAALN